MFPEVLRWLWRIALAAVFVASSLSKLFSIDDFELYIYSYGFFSLNATFILARLCIGAELALGIFLLSGWWRRWVNLAAFLMLLFFSLFLCFAILIGRTDSCQCFGKWMDIPPAPSLLKNAVLIVIVLAYNRFGGDGQIRCGSRLRGWLTAALVVAALVVPFVVSVPDSWMYRTADGRFNNEALQELIAPGGALEDYHLTEGNHIVAIVLEGCPYCRKAHEKMDSMVKRHSLDQTRIHYFNPGDLPIGAWQTISYGQIPLLILLADGQPVATYHYRNINERQICDALK